VGVLADAVVEPAGAEAHQGSVVRNLQQRQLVRGGVQPEGILRYALADQFRVPAEGEASRLGAGHQLDGWPSAYRGIRQEEPPSGATAV
jgi:hypothetical protein